MTSARDSTGIAALDELGDRLQAATARPRRQRPQRRWAAVALGALALAAAPALAGVLNSPESLEDQLPQVAAAVDYDDPVATGRALTRKGFRVRWVLINDAGDVAGSPTRSRDVAEPPPGTKILSVLNQNGGNDVAPDTRDLQIEVAPAGSRILESHR